MLGRLIVQIWLAFQSSYSARYGVTGKIGQASHRETCPGRVTSCVPMGSLATPMEFLRPTAAQSVVYILRPRSVGRTRGA